MLSGYRGNEAAVTRQHSLATLASARRSGDAWSLAWALHLHGLHCYYQLQDAATAPRILEESEALFDKIGDRRWRAVVTNLRAVLMSNEGDYASAQAGFEAALSIGQELDDQELTFKEMLNLGGLAVVRGDSTQAAELYARAVAHGRKHGAKRWTASALLGLAEGDLMRGDLTAAEPLLRESLSLVNELEHGGLYAGLLAKFARLAAARGQTVLAARAMGAIEAHSLQKKQLVDVDDVRPIELHRAWIQAAMRPGDFQAAFAAGKALTLKQAMQEVSTVAPDTAPAVAAPASSPAPLRLFALGPARAFMGERALTAWPYARVKELLFYLAAHPARTKAQIGLDLWPDASPAQLRNSLGTTLYHLRRVLGSSGWVVFEDEQYRFNDALGCQFDLHDFEDGLAQAGRLKAHDPEQATDLLQRAASLYQGDFVEDLAEGEWCRLRREALRRKYLDGLLELGQLYFSRANYAQAAEAYRRAIQKESILEAAHRELMRCYARLGERGQALRQYQTLAQTMQSELGSPPAPASAALYDQLKRGQHA